MIILEIIIGYNFYKFILLNNKIGLFQISFISINIIYKRIYKKLIIVIFNYEVFIEKSIIEILLSKLISLTLNLHSLKITNIKINIFLTIIITIFTIMIQYYNIFTII